MLLAGGKKRATRLTGSPEEPSAACFSPAPLASPAVVDGAAAVPNFSARFLRFSSSAAIFSAISLLRQLDLLVRRYLHCEAHNRTRAVSPPVTFLAHHDNSSK